MTFLATEATIQVTKQPAYMVQRPANNNIPKYDANGHIIDSGVSVSTDNSMGGSAPSDSLVSTQKAVKSYADSSAFINAIIFG